MKFFQIAKFATKFFKKSLFLRRFFLVKFTEING